MLQTYEHSLRFEVEGELEIEEEAIEIGLWHAVKESEEEEGVSQVILIGDMPAQSKEQVIARRQKHHSEEY